MDPRVDMDETDNNGYSVQANIGQFGVVMYVVVTRIRYDSDVFKGQDFGPAMPSFPEEDDLPCTEGVWPGSVIQRCWKRGGYRNMGELCSALEQIIFD